MTESTGIDEKKLLRRIANRDHHAFKVLYDQYTKKVYAHCFRLLHGEGWAEEAVQEIFLKLWLMEERLLTINHIGPYLKTLARNHCLNTIRRLVLEEETARLLTSGYTETHNETEEAILLNDTRTLLNTAIAALPEQQRLAYGLCHEQGLSYEEAADRLGISVNTLKTHMKRALATLRKQLEDHSGLPVLLILLKLF